MSIYIYPAICLLCALACLPAAVSGSVIGGGGVGFCLGGAVFILADIYYRG